MRDCGADTRYVRTFASGPSEAAPTFYEQMFAKATSKLAQRTLGALRLTHSFLLLEDDYDVDWEVDRNEELTQSHPHRVPLRGPSRRPRNTRARRTGEVVARPQPCLSPVAPNVQSGGPGRTRHRVCAAARKPRSAH